MAYQTLGAVMAGLVVREAPGGFVLQLYAEYVAAVAADVTSAIE